MLAFIDQEKNVKVMRVETDGDGTVKRQRLGIVPKKDLAPGPDFENLDADEKAELKGMVALYREAAETKARMALLSFPETCRIAVDYALSQPDELKRRVVLMALIEGLRLMRKAERDSSEPDHD